MSLESQQKNFLVIGSLQTSQNYTAEPGHRVWMNCPVTTVGADFMTNETTVSSKV